MPDTWKQALNAYCYPVNLANFADKHKYPGWFERDITGSLSETRAFEDRFRERAPHDLAAWYEVVYWKMFSTPPSRDKTTRGVISEVESDELTAKLLWQLCLWYMKPSPARV